VDSPARMLRAESRKRLRVHRGGTEGVPHVRPSVRGTKKTGRSPHPTLLP